MQFLYPSFLWALLALAIPIIIHLFHFRRFKKVYFTNVKFLKEVKEETSQRARLKHLLILALRLLTIAALVFAFAQPFIPKDEEVKQGLKAVSVYIDNSFSMSAMSSDVPLLEKAKQRAREIVKGYAVEDRFQIITNTFEGKQQRLLNKEDALTYIDEVEIAPEVRTLDKVLLRQTQALNTENIDNQEAYLVSDFQKNITNFSSFSDTIVQVRLVPLQSVQKRNVAIDSCWFEAPVPMVNQTNKLIIKLFNISDEKVEGVRLSLNHDGQVKPVGTLNIPAASAIYDTVNITLLKTGFHEAELNITDYPVQFDDKYLLSFFVKPEINVLSISEKGTNKYIKSAFAGSNYFKVTNLSSQKIDYSTLSNFDLIVLNDLPSISSGLSFELKQYSENGGNVLFFPSKNGNLETYKAFLRSINANEPEAFESQEREVASINDDEFIFNDVFEKVNANIKLPKTKGNFKMSSFSAKSGEALLKYRDNSNFLTKFRVGDGHVFFCSAPLNSDYSDLVSNGEIFIPMLYKMAISTGGQKPLAQTIGRDNFVEADNKVEGNELVYKMIGKEGEFIPSKRVIGSKVLLGLNNQIEEAGFYKLQLKANETIEKYAFNYDRKESRLDYYALEELEEIAAKKNFDVIEGDNQNLEIAVGERSRGVVFWKWCLIAALIFLGLETLLLRFWKK